MLYVFLCFEDLGAKYCVWPWWPSLKTYFNVMQQRSKKRWKCKLQYETIQQGMDCNWISIHFTPNYSYMQKLFKTDQLCTVRQRSVTVRNKEHLYGDRIATEFRCRLGVQYLRLQVQHTLKNKGVSKGSLEQCHGRTTFISQKNLLIYDTLIYFL